MAAVGRPFVQLAARNQSPTPSCHSVCSYRADDPAKRISRMIAIDHQLPNREPARNCVEPFTKLICNKLLPSIATPAFEMSNLSLGYRTKCMFRQNRTNTTLPDRVSQCKS